MEKVIELGVPVEEEISERSLARALLNSNEQLEEALKDEPNDQDLISALHENRFHALPCKLQRLRLFRRREDVLHLSASSTQSLREQMQGLSLSSSLDEPFTFEEAQELLSDPSDPLSEAEIQELKLIFQPTLPDSSSSEGVFL